MNKTIKIKLKLSVSVGSLSAIQPFSHPLTSTSPAYNNGSEVRFVVFKNERNCKFDEHLLSFNDVINILHNL